MKTANSGYLTRKLVDVAQDVVITMNDCKTLGYVEFEDLKEAGDILIFTCTTRVMGEWLLQDVKDPITGQINFTARYSYWREDLDRINDSAVSKITSRSTLSCQAKRGVCAICYGIDLSKRELVDVGTAVGYYCSAIYW